MARCYDIPEIVITVEGGVIQDVDIPKGTNVTVKVMDFDCDKSDKDGSHGEFVRENSQGNFYFQSIYESEE